MPSEIANAIFLTFVATEYLQQSSSSEASSFTNSTNKDAFRQVWKSRSVRIAGGLVTLLNVTEQLMKKATGIAATEAAVVKRLFHLPRVSFAAMAYLVVLYMDCKRAAGTRLSIHEYVQRVGVAFLRVAPVYPFLAVLISCVFMCVISALEAFHLNVDIFQWPLYYGVLYGPFSAVYWSVKRRVLQDFRYTLPTTTTSSGNDDDGEPPLGRSTGYATDNSRRSRPPPPTTSYQAWVRERHSVPSDATF